MTVRSKAPPWVCLEVFHMGAQPVLMWGLVVRGVTKGTCMRKFPEMVFLFSKLLSLRAQIRFRTRHLFRTRPQRESQSMTSRMSLTSVARRADQNRRASGECHE